MKFNSLSLLILISALVSGCGAYNYERDGAYDLPSSSSGGSSGGGSNPPGGGTVSCGDMNATACETFHVINEERIKAGLPALKVSTIAVAAAQEHSEDMDERGYFAHDRPEFPDRPAESFGQRMGRWGIWGGGENIASGFMDARSVTSGWMNSPGHRANILNPNYRSAGVGFKDYKYTQIFSMGD